jgi:hypothetical protein
MVGTVGTKGTNGTGGATITFSVISVREPMELGERATGYHVEIKQNGTWNTPKDSSGNQLKGTVIGSANSGSSTRPPLTQLLWSSIRPKVFPLSPSSGHTTLESLGKREGFSPIPETLTCPRMPRMPTSGYEKSTITEVRHICLLRLLVDSTRS